MNKNIWIIIGIIILIVLGNGIYAYLNNKGGVMVEEKDVMMKGDEISMMVEDDTMMKVGSYEEYAPEKIATASVTHDIVLFFRASWCPTCPAVDADIKANLSKIPSDLTILDVNYDNSASLKQKYGVTYQHTFVQVDSAGTEITKWNGGQTDELLANIK